MKRSNHYLGCHRRRGLTLVEVIAASTLLASLLVGMMLAFGGHQRQIRAAEDRLRAVALADQLLQSWGTNPVPRDRTGVIPDSRGSWLWRTMSLRRYRLANASFAIVRLEIFRSPRTNSVIRPAAMVDLVVRVEQP